MMNLPAAIFAQTTQAFREAFRGGAMERGLSIDPVILASVLGTIGLALAIASILSAVRRDRRMCGPTWRALCQSLGVTARQRRLLARIARRARMRSPASLLISRGCFEFATRYGPHRPGHRAQLAAVRQTVFRDAP